MRITILAVLFLLAIEIGTGLAHKHQCVHNKISMKFRPAREQLTEEERAHRLLLNSTTRQIKILIDESNLKASEKERDLIVGKLVPVATEFLKNRLTVISSGSPTKLSGGQCYEANIPAAHQTQGVDADLIIYVTASNEPNESYIAWATSCLLDAVTGRPIAGQINFNIAYLSYDSVLFEEQVDTTLHEITHILAFSDNLYPEFRKSFGSKDYMGEANVWQKDVVLRRGPRNVIKTPKVLEVARKYFGCESISGVELENEGGEGSAGAHWERTILHNEQMTASSIPLASYSEFTLAILHDSGWYQVDFSKAEPMYFGQGAGCEFINQGCLAPLPGRREFCDTNAAVCTFDFKSKGFCSSETFSDGCKYVMGYSNANCENPLDSNGDSRGETFASGSKCVIGNVLVKGGSPGSNNPLCYKYSCTSDGKIKFLPSGGGEIVCSREGETVSANGNYIGQIVCPNPVDFCKDYYPGCPNLCSSKGYCVKGKCECRAGFGGLDCSIVEAPKPEDPCASAKCPANSSCSKGTCVCFEGYSGVNCEKKVVAPTCLNKCNDRGTCDQSGKCSCYTGFSGTSCEKANYGFSGSCPDGCNAHLAHGACSSTQKTSFFFFKTTTYACKCNAGFFPPSCQ